MTRRSILVLLALAIPAAAAAQPGPLAAGGGAIARGMLGDCRTDLGLLNPISGWQTRWPGDLESLPVGTDAEREAAIERWGEAKRVLDADEAALRDGIAGDRTAPKPVVRRVLEQIDGFLAGGAIGSPADRADDPAFVARWGRLADGTIEPAVRRFRDFLVGTYLPAAREAPGLAAIEGGRACYLDAVEAWTTLRLTGPEIVARGEAYLDELSGEFAALTGAETPAERAATLDRLRAADFEDGFETREALVAHAERAIERAIEALPRWFAVPGENLVEVVPVDPSVEASVPAGYYRRPAGPGRPATYVINTGRVEERRLMSEVIAFHETVPGHHTSFAVPTAHGSPATASFNSGFAEGWALYSERLADEMGLYSTPFDRLGLVTKHLWAASRLVLEPGIHLDGWSRRRAIDYLVGHSALSEAEAAVEVDRYLAIPGQSLSYVLGFLHLRETRRDAEAALGERFDVRAFHDVVLRDGIRPLADVRRDVEAWVERTKAGA